MKMAMKYSSNKGRLGVRRRRKNYIVRKRVIVPYGKEIAVRGFRG